MYLISCPIVFLFFILIFCVKSQQIDPLLVETKNGWVYGLKMYDYMYSWRGIPYATPPIGELRFEPPQPPDNWTDVWNATDDRDICVQYNTTQNAVIGSENCLWVNVYTPELPSSSTNLKTVMVFIHGGYFLIGSSRYATYAPDYLIQKNVVVVTFNYRLSIMGFASTGDDVLPGNNGLRDQILALKWVQQNIKAFGGNPDEVTVFGQSAGAASISYLILSPLAKGLFRYAILESGTALCPWALSRTATAATGLVGLQLFQSSNLNSTDLVQCLKQDSADSLVLRALGVEGSFIANDPWNGLSFAPVQEHDDENAVFSSNAYEDFQNGSFQDIPYIIGYNSEEGLYFFDEAFFFRGYLAQYDLYPERLVPVDMYANMSLYRKIGVAIKDHYAGSFGSLVLPISNMIHFMSDDFFVRAIQKNVDLTSEYTSAYLYRFSYTGNSSSTGVGHTEELQYIFKSSRNSEQDQLVRNYTVTMWTNFAKTGNPTPENISTLPGHITWLPANTNGTTQVNFLNIDLTPTAGINPNEMDVNFWFDLYDQYGDPQDTF